MEIRNYVEKQSEEHLNEMVKAALYFDQLYQEGILMNKLLSEGDRALKEERLCDALFLFGEANNIERRDNQHGKKIIATLAYIEAMIGDYLKAQLYLDQFEKDYGQPSSSDKEYEMIQTAIQMIKNPMFKDIDRALEHKSEIECAQCLLKGYQYNEAIDKCLEVRFRYSNLSRFFPKTLKTEKLMLFYLRSIMNQDYQMNQLSRQDLR